MTNFRPSEEVRKSVNQLMSLVLRFVTFAGHLLSTAAAGDRHVVAFVKLALG
jgi:hypothetical protein